MATAMSSESGFFQESNPKLDDIKKALEDNSISGKLDAMKRLIAMISKGRDVSSLFPNVVKNVICANSQVKRLVYMYLIHYAEFEQDLALLSINTFQKDLDDPSPLIRSQALRVLSSIRLKVITHILVISIKRCASDNSPYVRKTAAHAIPKVFGLDHSQKEELVDSIETLLGDNTTLVLGSAMAAFSEVCPERVDLIHPHFRKYCNMLADIDEWGQTSILNILARYARTQFGNPNPNERPQESRGKAKKKSSSFYSDEESGEDDDDDEYDKDFDDGHTIDSDHRLLLRSVAPLLQSRNTSVVVAASMLFYYCAPQAEAMKIGKALIRVVRTPPQISYFVLQNILTMSRSRPELFGPYISEFFVYDSDPNYIRELKLEILTNVSTESNVSRILKEFTHYVKRADKKFVTATIQAIGTSAVRLPEVQESCMAGLISLLSNRSEIVVAESVVVIKKLLQLGAGTDVRIITHLAKLLDTMTVPHARASIIWIVGEYANQIPTYAPDILRRLAASYKTEDKLVKQQIITLGSKLLLREPEDQTVSLLFQYVCNMTKFDMNYDLRDRARLFRTILIGNAAPTLKQHSMKLLCSEKPAPEATHTREGDIFALNSLSHIVNHTAVGYLALQDWPTEIPDGAVRDRAARKQRSTYVGGGAGSFTPGGGGGAYTTTPTGATTGTGGFYSDEDSGEFSDFSEEGEDDFYDDAPKKKSKPAKKSTGGGAAAFFGAPAASTKKKAAAAYSDEDDDDFSDFSDEEDSPPPVKKQPAPKKSAAKPAAGSDDFFFGGSSKPVAAAPGGDLLSNDLLGLDFGGSSDSPAVAPMSAVPAGLGSFGGTPASPSAVTDAQATWHVLLKEVITQGLRVEYCFLRQASQKGPSFNAIQMRFTNKSQDAFKSITITPVTDNGNVAPTDPVAYLAPGGQAEAVMDVKFGSPTTRIKLKVAHEANSYPVELAPSAGELITQGGAIVESEFAAAQKKLGGMQEVSGKFPVKEGHLIAPAVLAVANVALLLNDVSAGLFHFAGKTMQDGQTLLVSVEVREGFARMKVNSSNAIFANTLHRDLKKVLERK